MSADNGIYIHHFKNGWKVTEAGAIENIFWDEKNKCIGPEYNQKELNRYFRNSPLFKSEDEAWKYARKLYKEYSKDGGIIEYGICEV